LQAFWNGNQTFELKTPCLGCRDTDFAPLQRLELKLGPLANKIACNEGFCARDGYYVLPRLGPDVPDDLHLFRINTDHESVTRFFSATSFWFSEPYGARRTMTVSTTKGMTITLSGKDRSQRL